jgi:hypothetical protein
MKPVSKTAIISIIVIALIGFGAWLYLWLLTEEYIRSDKKKDNSIEVLRKNWAKATNDNLLYRHRYNEAQDTIVQLTRQLGWAEVELGVKKDELKQASAKYKSSRQVKDTARALNICDSIVYTHVPAYMYTDSAYGVWGDSLREFTGNWLVNQNGIIESQSITIDTLYKAQIADKTEEKKQGKKESKKRKGAILKAGFFGAAIGVLLTLIFGG